MSKKALGILLGLGLASILGACGGAVEDTAEPLEEVPAEEVPAEEVPAEEAPAE